MITIGNKTYTDEEWEAHITASYGPKGEPIEADEQAILALTRVTTGADIHDTNVLISNYRYFCKQGRQQAADRAKRRMYERAIRLGGRKMNFA